MKRFIFLLTMLAGLSAVCRADIIAYPNPWIPDDVHTSRGNLTDGITFKGIPAGAAGEIFVYTVSGNQVRHISFPNSTGKEKWTGKNDDGDYVASGVYLWVVKIDQQTKTGKLVVVR
jgi:hypothetical protein